MTCAVEISHFDKDQLGLIQTQSINQNYIYTCIYRYIYIYMQLSHYGTLTARHPWHLKQGEEQSDCFHQLLYHIFCQLQCSRYIIIKKPFLCINSLLNLYCIYCCSDSYNVLSKWDL